MLYIIRKAVVRRDNKGWICKLLYYVIMSLFILELFSAMCLLNIILSFSNEARNQVVTIVLIFYLFLVIDFF